MIVTRHQRALAMEHDSDVVGVSRLGAVLSCAVESLHRKRALFGNALLALHTFV